MLFLFPGPVAYSQCVQDRTVADFISGTPDAGIEIAEVGDGAVRLKSTAYVEFGGTALPAGWESFKWGSTGGSVVSNGSVKVNGARLNTVPQSSLYYPGSVMEFTATFAAEAIQHIGFGGGTDAGITAIFKLNPFAIFSTFNGTSKLYARVSGGSYEIPNSAALIGTSHEYKIVWKTDGFEFYVDGALVHSTTSVITDGMRPAISDYTNDATEITVDRVSTAPYSSGGIFESRVFSAGATVDWGAVTWNADLPAQTGLSILVRGGNNPVPDGSWTAFTAVPGSGSTAGINTQYIQYRAVLSTANTLYSPVLKDISIACGGATAQAPVITLHPLSQSACDGSNVTFTCHATGMPAPSVQWQENTGGAGWTNINGEVYPSLTLQATSEKQYRAVWTNSEGSITSDAATLTMKQAPAGTISASPLTIFEGEDYGLEFNATAGQGPYSVIISGNTYSGLSGNASINAGTASYEPVSFWPPELVGEANTTDQTSYELGLRFTTSIAGKITGIRFYKTGTESKQFTVTLWSPEKTSIGSASITTDTPGWKTVLFSSPVDIAANTTYAASYYCNSGNYLYAFSKGFTPPYQVGAMTLLNFVYAVGHYYPATPNTANYFADVIFDSSVGSKTFSLTSITGNNGCVTTGNPLSMANVTIDRAMVWTGAAGTSWNGSGNWSDGTVPVGENIVIPVVANNNYPVITGQVNTGTLIIKPSASMTVDPGGQLTVNGDLTTTGGTFVINSSSPTNNGSMIVNGVSTGNVTYNRAMPADKYRYLSPPVGMSTLPAGTYWRWNEPIGAWGESAAEAPTTVASSGLGYTALAASNSISFTGSVVVSATQTATAPYNSEATRYEDERTPAGGVWGGGGWNLLGNPYTSSLRITDSDGSSGNDFIGANLGSFDPSYQAVYIYNGTSYSYIAKGTVPGFEGDGVFPANIVQVGQGFLLLANYNNVVFNFNRAMQIHNSTVPMTKKGGDEDPWPGLALKIGYGATESITQVVYNEEMTAGLDPGFDVGLLTSGAPAEIYTTLVGDAASVNFTRQAISTADLNNAVVPVGIDCGDGGQVIFSAHTIQQGSNRFWLEDRLTGIFTDLCSDTYTVTIPAETYGTGRFFIYASVNTPTGIEKPKTESDLRIWHSSGRIIIQGERSGRATCEIFDMRGVKVVSTYLEGGEISTIDLPAGTRGVLVVRVTEGAKVTTRKVPVM